MKEININGSKLVGGSDLKIACGVGLVADNYQILGFRGQKSSKKLMGYGRKRGSKVTWSPQGGQNFEEKCL